MVEEVLVHWIPWDHVVNPFHERDVVSSPHVDSDKIELLLLATLLLQGGEVSLDDCHRLPCKQTLPSLTQFSYVLHHQGRVHALNQQIWIVLILCWVREVHRCADFCPLCANRADAIRALDAGAMLPVVKLGFNKSKNVSQTLYVTDSGSHIKWIKNNFTNMYD